MISINVWPGIGVIGSGGNVGHGSLTCGSTYMSWWPAAGSVGIGEFATQMTVGRGSIAEQAFIRTTVPGAPEGYNTDVASEGNRAPNSFRFSGHFNEAAILQAWQGWMRVGTYNVAERSCCSCVVTLLEFSGLARVVPNYETFIYSSLAGRRVVSPYGLMSLARAIETSLNPERAPSMSAGVHVLIDHPTVR